MPCCPALVLVLSQLGTAPNFGAPKLHTHSHGMVLSLPPPSLWDLPHSHRSCPPPFSCPTSLLPLFHLFPSLAPSHRLPAACCSQPSTHTQSRSAALCICLCTRYRAPECLLTDGYYNYKMDMWGVGCVFFEIVSLFPLFPGACRNSEEG